MDIRNFIAFQAVVDCGGFTKAAEICIEKTMVASLQ